TLSRLFFFQADDGIRDKLVTGVQTCALPISTERAACQGDVASGRAPRCFGRAQRFYRAVEFTATKRFTNNYQFIASYVYSSLTRSEERRVGKECRSLSTAVDS